MASFRQAVDAIDFSTLHVYLRVPSPNFQQYMALTPSEIWARLLERVRLELPEQSFRTWLEPTEALEITDNTLFVGTPDRFAAEWNESKYAQLLASTAPVALGYPINIIFKVTDERQARPQMDFFVAPVPEEHREDSPASTKPNTANLNARYTFDNFVIGKSNELAAAAAQAVAASPGKVYNPLFIYGATGLGKTHLMQAVAHEIAQRTLSTRIRFVSGEQFTNEFVLSIRNRTAPEFRRKYRETDLLLADDVQFLKGKEATQEEFFHTFNALYEAGRQIILTSDRPPSEIPGLEARLVSRFQWGMVADIELPELEHRIAILQNKTHLDHVEFTIPDDVILFVAEHVQSNVRELEGTVIKLLAYASLKRRGLTVELAREVMRDKLRLNGDAQTRDQLTLSTSSIQQAVARDWDVTVQGLCSKSRIKQLAIPRQVAMYLIRDLLGTQLVEIGNSFGGRDHSTVIHSLEKVESKMKEDQPFTQRVINLKTTLEKLRA